MKHMDALKTNWETINNLEDYYITYLLYKEGKSIEAISIIRGMSKPDVEKHIIQGKIKMSDNDIKDDLLIKVISLNKRDRIRCLEELSENDKKYLEEDIYKRYTKFKNTEDRMIVIWIVGEIKAVKLLPFLKMELKGNNVNLKRLACSALGKIRNIESKAWLETMISDKNPQVRQYAIKALQYMADKNTILSLEKVLNDKNEKEYVKRAAVELVTKTREKLSII